LCHRHCPLGNVRDERGCALCECYECPPTCFMECPNGFETDDTGCEICKCAEEK
jgi:hypothetical protein